MTRPVRRNAAASPPEPGPELLDPLRALDNARRLQILRWLKEPTRHFRPQVDGDSEEDGVCGLLIAEKLGLSQPTVSEHMRVLVRSGLVRAKRIQQWTFYRRDEERLEAFLGALHTLLDGTEAVAVHFHGGALVVVGDAGGDGVEGPGARRRGVDAGTVDGPPAAPSCTDQLTAVDWPPLVPVTASAKFTVPPAWVEAERGDWDGDVERGRDGDMRRASEVSATLVATTWKAPAVPGAVYRPDASTPPPLAPS